MAKEIELYLEPDGFYAGKKNKDGKLAKGAHKLTEDEIFTMFTTLVRTFAAKTGQDTLVIHGNDGKAVIAKLVDAMTLLKSLRKRPRRRSKTRLSG